MLLRCQIWREKNYYSTCPWVRCTQVLTICCTTLGLYGAQAAALNAYLGYGNNMNAFRKASLRLSPYLEIKLKPNTLWPLIRASYQLAVGGVGVFSVIFLQADASTCARVSGIRYLYLEKSHNPVCTRCIMGHISGLKINLS